jgi:hypothetical protein
MLAPLEGSKIEIGYESGYPHLTIPQPSGGMSRYFAAAFMVFWLGGWAFGWIATARQLLKRNGPIDVFLIFWICGWTVGGIFAMRVLFKLLRPSVPETLVLSKPTLIYDSGISPTHMSFGSRSSRETYGNLSRERVQLEFSPADLQTLALREFETGNRLTIDQGNKRVDIAAGATEREREWLFEALWSHYNS